MLSAGEEYQIQAAAELLLGFREEHPELLRGQADALSCLKERKLSTQTRILLDRLDGEEEKAREEYTEENGFGLYDPKELERQAEQLEKEGILQPEREDAGWFSALLPSEKEYLAVLERLNGVFARHADYEYETESYDGTRTKVLFGNVSMQTVPIPASFGNGAQLRIRQAVTPEMIPFWEEFREAFGAYASDPEKMLGFCYTACRWNSPYVYRAATAAWFADTESRFAPDYHTAAYGIYQARYWQMMDVTALLVQIFSPKEVFPAAFRCYRCAVELIGRENLSRKYLETDQEKTVVWQGRRMIFRSTTGWPASGGAF